MNKMKLEDIRDLTLLNNKHTNIVHTGIVDDSIPLVYDVSPDESPTNFDFLDNSEENQYQSEHLEPNEELFFSQSSMLQVSFEISSIIDYGKLFSSEIMDVFLFIVKDKKLLASLIGLVGLSAILFYFLPFAYNLSAILFLCAPLSMAIIGFYKKERAKSKCGLRYF